MVESSMVGTTMTGPRSGLTPWLSGKMTLADEKLPPKDAGETLPTDKPDSPHQRRHAAPENPEPGKAM